jgi:hypothetical protein
MPMRRLAVVVILSISLVACDGGSEVPCGDRGSLTGVVLSVESRSLTDVRAFTVRSQDEECEIAIDPDIDYGFPLSHLNAHKVDALPVTVEVEVRDAQLVALSIVDATTGS